MCIQPPASNPRTLHPAQKSTRPTSVMQDKIKKQVVFQADELTLSQQSPKSTARMQARLLSKLKTSIADNQLNEAKTIAAQITDPDLKTEDRTPLLHFFARTNHKTAVKMIVQDLKKDSNTLDESERNALHILDNHQGAMANLLMNLGTEPNAWDYDGRTPLYTAVLQRKPDLIQVFLNNPKTKPNRQDDLGFTPLSRAIDKGYLKIVKILAQDARVDFDIENCNGHNAFDLAAAKGGEFPRILEEAKAMRAKKPSNKETEKLLGFSDLSSKVVSAAPDSPSLPVTQNAETNQPEGSKAHPLSLTTWEERVKKLTSRRDCEDDTLLHWAAAQGKTRLMKALVNELNADPSLRNGKGKTAFQLAKENGHEGTARYLLATPWRQGDKR